ncbi:MAG: isoprenylcysteine carboxylmethyltransferase family protein [Verrucomicrobia bacterium]|nr:isoprenylcysteine carboxylmethyltransferase family protein [Verrucomicrobiota bacterium]MBU1909316.1 isoprenylcysteine carboxylmethyltransferase family protein [Verrucomicrobiota bacterium]
MKKLVSGVVISSIFVIMPALGNLAILRAAQLWILLALGVLASVLQPGYNPFTIARRARDKGTGAQIIWSVYAVQLAAIMEAAYLRYPQSVAWDSVAVIALIVAAIGLSLRTWAVLTLGRLFTMHIAVEKGHRFVRSGPYARIRHPSYLGAFLLYVSTTIFLHAWFSAIAAVLILPLAFLRRIHREECVLKEEFGAEYESYCAEVKMILPGIW